MTEKECGVSEIYLRLAFSNGISFDVAYGRVEENVDVRKGVESVRSVSTKHFDLLRPFARSNSRGNNSINMLNDFFLFSNCYCYKQIIKPFF
jgi:hypothetical protein